MKKNNYLYQELIYPQKKVTRYFLPLEWANLPYLEPLFFVEVYFREGKNFALDRRAMQIYSLNTGQIIFNRILRRFLQSPIDQYFSDFLKREVFTYSIFREIFLKHQYSINPLINFDSQKPADLIIELFRDLENLKKQIQSRLQLQQKGVKIKEQFNAQDFQKLGWPYPTIHFLQALSKKKLDKFIDCFLIHGSLATKDFLENWSDLDALIILNNQIFQSSHILNQAQKQFRKLALLCYKIDPLAHHQFMFLTNFDLNYYPSFLFPPILYQYSLLLFGQSNLEINLRSDQYEKIQMMGNFVNYFRNKVLNQEYSRDRAGWKNDLAHLMLWPSLLLQAKNIYLYKKYSFQRAKKEFPEIDWQIIDQASQMRKDWLGNNLLKYYPNFLFNLLPPGINQFIFNRVRKRMRQSRLLLTSREIKRITKIALDCLEKSFSLILKNLKNV